MRTLQILPREVASTETETLFRVPVRAGAFVLFLMAGFAAAGALGLILRADPDEPWFVRWSLTPIGVIIMGVVAVAGFLFGSLALFTHETLRIDRRASVLVHEVRTPRRRRLRSLPLKAIREIVVQAGESDGEGGQNASAVRLELEQGEPLDLGREAHGAALAFGRRLSELTGAPLREA